MYRCDIWQIVKYEICDMKYVHDMLTSQLMYYTYIIKKSYYCSAKYERILSFSNWYAKTVQSWLSKLGCLF